MKESTKKVLITAISWVVAIVLVLGFAQLTNDAGAVTVVGVFLGMSAGTITSALYF